VHVTVNKRYTFNVLGLDLYARRSLCQSSNYITELMPKANLEMTGSACPAARDPMTLPSKFSSITIQTSLLQELVFNICLPLLCRGTKYNITAHFLSIIRWMQAWNYALSIWGKMVIGNAGRFWSFATAMAVVAASDFGSSQWENLESANDRPCKNR
jgi:hypothetical protein